MKLCVDVTEVLECGSVGELGREECEKREDAEVVLALEVRYVHP